MLPSFSPSFPKTAVFSSGRMFGCSLAALSSSWESSGGLASELPKVKCHLRKDSAWAGPLPEGALTGWTAEVQELNHEELHDFRFRIRIGDNLFLLFYSLSGRIWRSMTWKGWLQNKQHESCCFPEWVLIRVSLSPSTGGVSQLCSPMRPSGHFSTRLFVFQKLEVFKILVS